MSKEYIDREAILNLCNEMIAEPWNLKTAPASWSDAYLAFKDDVEHFPAADVIQIPITGSGGRLRGVIYENGKVTNVHIMDTDGVVKGFEPVRHGHFVVNWLGDCHCSNCGEYCDSAKPFCASCGARFDEPEMREN